MTSVGSGKFRISRLVILGGVLLAAPLAFTVRATTIGTLAGASGSVIVPQANDPFEYWFDEQGNGRYRIFLPGSPPGPIVNSPGQVINGNLTYFLPSPVVTGDVRIWEDSARTVLSDVLRFTDAAGNLSGGLTGDRMIYFSETAEPGEAADLADTGIPTSLVVRDGGGIVEVGPEGNNGFDYAPGGPFDNTYHGISDVPEPSTLTGVALGLLTILWRARRRV